MSLAALAGTGGAQRSQGGVKKGVKEKGGQGKQEERDGWEVDISYYPHGW